eukprot:1910093-Amphidinium_carterae.1
MLYNVYHVHALVCVPPEFALLKVAITVVHCFVLLECGQTSVLRCPSEDALHALGPENMRRNRAGSETVAVSSNVRHVLAHSTSRSCQQSLENPPMLSTSSLPVVSGL